MTSTDERTVVCHFGGLASMTAVGIGEHVLAVPGRGEARALTDCCPRCWRDAQPASVLDQVADGRTASRIATYRCTDCEAAWLCSWAPANRDRRTLNPQPSTIETSTP